MTEQELAVVFLSAILGLVTLAMGLELTVDDFRRVVAKPRAVAVGMLGQIIGLPILAFALVPLFGLPPELAVGAVLLAACPGGAHSNLYTYFAKGDVALSVTMTALSNVIVMATLPAIVYIATRVFAGEGQIATISPFDATMQLVVVLGIPLAVGMAVRARSPRLAARVGRYFKGLAAILLVLVIVLSVAQNRARMVELLALSGAPMLTLNLASMALAYALARAGRLPDAQVSTILLEVGIQNGTLAVGLAKTLTGDWSVAAPGIVYSLLVYFTGGLAVAWGRRRAAARGAAADPGSGAPAVVVEPASAREPADR